MCKIIDKYKEINHRLQRKPYYNSMKSSMVTTMRAFTESRQERFFHNYDAERNKSDCYLRQTCNRICRCPSESIIIKSENYRQKLEKVCATETEKQTSVIYGAQNWLLSLRNSKQCNEKKHCVIGKRLADKAM